MPGFGFLAFAEFLRPFSASSWLPCCKPVLRPDGELTASRAGLRSVHLGDQGEVSGENTILGTVGGRPWDRFLEVHWGTRRFWDKHLGRTHCVPSLGAFVPLSEQSVPEVPTVATAPLLHALQSHPYAPLRLFPVVLSPEQHELG